MTAPSTASRRCPRCGGSVPADAPEGLCAPCLLKGALSPSDSTLEIPGGGKSAAAAAVPTNAPAKVHYFGDYELIDEVARGGMGIVYRARQVSLNRVVAVKMILSGQLASDAEVKRFRVEAEAAANLQHPHIVAIHEIGEHEGRHYFSMDFIAGKNLLDHTLARPEPLTAQESSALIKVLAEAVHYAHQRGTLHRDLKPQNILIDAQGRPHITDFGLAKRWEASAATPAVIAPNTDDESRAATAISSNSSDLTRTGAILGSPSYMAPEQAAGRLAEIGPATDVYSLGAILYQLLTGAPPHRGATAFETVQKVVAEEPAAPRKLRPNTPPDLETICLKCLEKSPAARYATARQLAEECERFLAAEPILAKPAGALRKLWSWGVRHPWAISGTVSSLIVGLSLVTYGLWEKTRYLTWLSAHSGPSPYEYWPGVINRELPKPTLLVLLAIWLVTGFSYNDLYQHRAVSVRPGARRLGFHLTVVLLFIVSWFFMTAKVVRICIWTDAPTGVMLPMILFLQPLLWQGLQTLWQVVRTVRTQQTGVEPPPDFLTLAPPRRIRGDGPFSLRRIWQIDVALMKETFRDTIERSRELGIGLPLLSAFGALVLASWFLARGEKVLWVVSGFVTVIFVQCLTGALNPRWILTPSAFAGTSINAVRFSYVIAAVGIFAPFALLVATNQLTGLTDGAGCGLLAGLGVVFWRRHSLRRRARAVAPGSDNNR